MVNLRFFFFLGLLSREWGRAIEMLITGNKIFIEELETYEFLKKKNIYDF